MGTKSGRQPNVRVAFLRGINVVGKVLLPMAKLRALCEGIGLKRVRTLIQSGNVVFESGLSEEVIVERLMKALLKSEKREIRVVLRTAKELASILARNPFPDANPSQVGVMLFVRPVGKDFMNGVSTTGREEVRVLRREVFIHYPDGMGRSKLKLPRWALAEGTVRNVNTIRRLVEMCEH